MSEKDNDEKRLISPFKSTFDRIKGCFKPKETQKSHIREIWEKYLPGIISGSDKASIYQTEARSESIEFLAQTIQNEPAEIQERVAEILTSKAEDFQKKFKSEGNEKDRILAELHIRAAQQIKEQLKKFSFTP